MKLVVASKNKGKIEEIRYVFRNIPYEIVSMEDIGITDDIEESGTTFEENALIKARYIMNATGIATLADDSGLEVDFLDGAPGVYSSRYAGENATDEEKIQKILSILKGVPFKKRGARFVCVIAVVFSDGREFLSTGTFDGVIAEQPVGENGFGYDPILFVPEQSRTVAQMNEVEKNAVSHRGKALRAMQEQLSKAEIL